MDEELEAWRSRSIGNTPYVILDARYEKVRHGGSVRDCAVLIAIGIPELVRKYAENAPDLAAWMETDIPEGFTIFELPETHRRRLRTTNMLERLNQEIKRRTRVATLFPNEASLLRLSSEILSEVSDDWETGKVYLTMPPMRQANGTQRKASGIPKRRQ